MSFIRSTGSPPVDAAARRGARGARRSRCPSAARRAARRCARWPRLLAPPRARRAAAASPRASAPGRPRMATSRLPRRRATSAKASTSSGRSRHLLGLAAVDGDPPDLRGARAGREEVDGPAVGATSAGPSRPRSCAVSRRGRPPPSLPTSHRSVRRRLRSRSVRLTTKTTSLAVRRDLRVGDAVHREHVVDRERMGRPGRGRREADTAGRTASRKRTRHVRRMETSRRGRCERTRHLSPRPGAGRAARVTSAPGGRPGAAGTRERAAAPAGPGPGRLPASLEGPRPSRCKPSSNGRIPPHGSEFQRWRARRNGPIMAGPIRRLHGP